MNTNIYQVIPLKKKSFLQKVFGQEEKFNALIEINNLLASYSILDIKMTQVFAIAQKYKLNLPLVFERNFDEFYAAYLKHCLDDKKISGEETQVLKHLKKLLGMSAEKITYIHEKMAGTIFQQEVKDVFAKEGAGAVSLEWLTQVQKDLALPEKIAAKITGEEKITVVQEYIREVIADGKLSPEEEKKLENLVQNLNLELKMDEETRSELERMKMYWRIENQPLIPVTTEVQLAKSEICYYTAPAKWYELRIAAVRNRRLGGSSGIITTKGFYYSLEHNLTQNAAVTEMKQVDSGTVFLTNKRICFNGNLGNKYIRYDKILSFRSFMNGLEIEKETGKIPFLAMNGDMEMTSLLFSRLLKES